MITTTSISVSARPISAPPSSPSISSIAISRAPLSAAAQALALALAGCSVASATPRAPESAAPNASAVAPASPVTASASATAATPATTHEPRVNVRVEVRDLSSGASLAASSMVVEPRRTVDFATSRRGEDAAIQLKLRVDPHSDAAYAVAIDWDERSTDGRVVRWAPTMSVAPGAEARAEVGWGEGQGRRLSLVVEPAR